MTKQTNKEKNLVIESGINTGAWVPFSIVLLFENVGENW